MSIGLPQAMALKQTITELGFEAKVSEQMFAAVEKKVLAAAAAVQDSRAPGGHGQKKPKEDSKPQTLMKPETYMTLEDWAFPGPARLEVLLRRYMQLGITSLTEQSVKRGMAFLLAMAAGEFSQMPTYEEIYEEVHVFKRFLGLLETGRRPETRRPADVS